MKYLKFSYLTSAILFFSFLISSGAFTTLVSAAKTGGNFEIDLEDYSAEFVLDTHRIDIPGYPKAFNPSIVRWHSRYLMSFRHIPETFVTDTNLICSGPSKIGLVWLDDNFNAVSTPQILDTCPDCDEINSFSRSEDARLVIVSDSLYIVYSDNNEKLPTLGGYRMYVAELFREGDLFSLGPLEHIIDFPGENSNRREKNWVPFDYLGTLLFGYTISPNQMFYPVFGSGKCSFLLSTKWNNKWKWGELRGGTPALPIDNRRYLSFFHSSIYMSTVHSEGKNVPHYFMGAYTFSRDIPFEITHISPEPIIGKGFYHGATYEPYWKPVVVVFPCGMIIDRNVIWVSYGRQDHEVWIAKIDKRKLLKSLVPIAK